MIFPSINFDGLNEADIRAEVIDPLLRRLGYQSGTEHNIERERILRYPRMSLGRKKQSDPEIRGRPDYILEVRGIGRWIVEAKPPNEEISADDVEQGFSYAFLPEVAAAYFVLCNGRKIQVYRTISGPAALPLIELTYPEIETHFQVLSNTLGPLSFRQALLNEHIDTGRPLAPGLPSTLRIVAGEVEYTKATSNVPGLAERMNRNVGMRLPVEQGFVWRLEHQLVVKVEQGFLHKLQESTFRGMGVREVIYRSSDNELSIDPSHPNIFEATMAYDLKKGSPQFDIFTQQESVLQFDATMTTNTEAVGVLNGFSYTGTFYGAGKLRANLPGAQLIAFEVLGTFRLKLAN